MPDLQFHEAALPPIPRRVINITGNTYGRLLVLSYASMRQHHSFWLCKCLCGAFLKVSSSDLRSGHTASCGCAQTTHGLSKTYFMRVLANMIQRCCNKKNPRYHNYGGRGITVCKRWRDSVELFAKDMGPRPSPKHTVERINNNGNYEPDNCRWATQSEQQRNKRNSHLITLDGKTQCLSDWANETGIIRATLNHRVNYLGWDARRALCTPIKGALPCEI